MNSNAERVVPEASEAQVSYLQGLVGQEVTVQVNGRIRAVGNKFFGLDVSQDYFSGGGYLYLPVYSALVSPAPTGTRIQKGKPSRHVRPFAN